MRKEARLWVLWCLPALVWLGVVPARSGASWPPGGACPPPFVGGPPTFLPAPAPYGVPAYGTPAGRPPAGRPPAARAAAPRNPAAGLASRPSPPVTQPVVRAAPPDEAPAARPAALNMPSPQRLGVGLSAAAPAGIDWATVGRQLQTVGATGCHLDPIPEGGYRFTCWLPGAQPGVAQRVEGTAATEAEAARLALDRAAQIKNRRP